jgi:histidinol-phosphatase (PHP family)
MEALCRRALKIDLPALAFTEHLDLTGWVVDREDLLDHLRPLVSDNGLLTPEPLDAAGYLESVERCRRQFLELRIFRESSSVSHTSTQTRRGSSSTSPHWIV